MNIENGQATASEIAARYARPAFARAPRYPFHPELRAMIRGQLVIALLLVANGSVLPARAADEVMPRALWENPPQEARPVARWWWPGGSVETAKLRRHLEQIASAGFGAVELQPLLLGLGDDDLAADPKLRTVGEPGFRALVAGAAAEAKKLGMAFDVTLGSGWPGGLPTSEANSEQELRMGHFDVAGEFDFDGPLPPPPEQSYRVSTEWVLDVLGPEPDTFELVAVLAGRVGQGPSGVATLGEVRDITHRVSKPSGRRRLDWKVPAGRWRIFSLYRSATRHFVMGGAFPGDEADALVVDHLSERGADALLEGYGTPLLEAAGPGAVRELFVDSFELLGELPFSPGFRTAFREQMGYDVTPYLPLLFRNGGESKYAEMMDLLGKKGGPLYLATVPGRAVRVREDYEIVRRRLFEEVFVGRLAAWCYAKGVKLRLQAHGGFGDYLDTYALSDVPESEGLFAAGSFDFLKLASSAAHVADRRWVSSESFITLRLWGRSLTHDEMVLLAGRAYSAGINRIAYHGVPYPYSRADGAAWYPFSGGFGRILAGPLPMSFEIDVATLPKLPDFNRFLSRLSVAMSHGEPAADIAWLRADQLYPDAASFQLGRIEPHKGESDPTRVLRGRGLTHDRVSRRMLTAAQAVDGGVAIGARRYRALLLDPLDVAEPELVEALARVGEAGVPILTLGALPKRAPGHHDSATRDARVRNAVRQLAKNTLAARGSRLEGALERVVRGAVVEPAADPLTVSLERRATPSGDLVLVVNESWSETVAHLSFLRAGGELAVWDPWSGEKISLRKRVAVGDTVGLALEAAQSLVLTLEKRADGEVAANASRTRDATRRSGS
jgi:hypothetical protein